MTAQILRVSSTSPASPDSGLFVNAAAQGGPPSFLRRFTGTSLSTVAKNQALNGGAASIVGTPTLNAGGYVTFPPGVGINTGLTFAPAMSFFGISRCTGFTATAGGYSALIGNSVNASTTAVVNLNLFGDLNVLYDNNVGTDLALPAAGAIGYPTSWFLWGLRTDFIGQSNGGEIVIDNFTAGTRKTVTSLTAPPTSSPAATIYIGSQPGQTFANYAPTDWKATAIFPYLIPLGGSVSGNNDESLVLAQLRAWAQNDLGAVV